MITVLVKYKQTVEGVREDLWTTETRSKVVEVKSLLELNDLFRELVDIKILCFHDTVARGNDPTFEVNLNTKESVYKRCNEITKVLKTPCKVYLYDGENYIELKTF